MLADTFKTLSDAYVYDPREKPPPGLLTFKPMFITTVLTADEVSNACKVLRREPAIGFDVEWNPSRIKGSPPGNVATVQLSTSTQSFVFPIKRMSGPARVTLSHLLCDQSIKKVGLTEGRLYPSHMLSRAAIAARLRRAKKRNSTRKRSHSAGPSSTSNPSRVSSPAPTANQASSNPPTGSTTPHSNATRTRKVGDVFSEALARCKTASTKKPSPLQVLRTMEEIDGTTTAHYSAIQKRLRRLETNSSK